MPAIGYVTKQSNGSFKGQLKTLSIRAEVEIIPNRSKSADSQPDYRVSAGGVEVGAGWVRTGEASGRDYVSLSLAAPELGRVGSTPTSDAPPARTTRTPSRSSGTRPTEARPSPRADRRGGSSALVVSADLDLADGKNRANLPSVKHDLTALPQGKQDELAFVVDVIRQGFAHATARRTQPHLRAAKLLKIVLFGSYARGTWVDDPVGRYFSDYDLLIVVNHDDLTDYAEYWEKIDRKLIDAGAAGTRLRTQVSLAPHSLNDINEQLRLGRYFFIDAVSDGVVLFEEEGHPFAEPQSLTAQQALDETRSFFDAFFTSANEFMDNYRFNLGLMRTNNAAFQLHQAAERAYHCALLVGTLYSPKTHKLTKLRAMAEDYEPRLRVVWPNENRNERRAYGLLVDAYVKARYSLQYSIDTEQLEWLGSRVALLLDLVRQISVERVSELEKAA
jgi:uncharacterized protein (DUF736 family)/predicted nucleotidyltransferase/HEPN domain-containing protein